MIFIATAAFVFALDYFVKRWAEKELAGKERKKIGNSGLSLKFIKNYGFAFNKLDKKPSLVKFIHLAVVVFLACYGTTTAFFQKGKEWAALGMAFILGGGLSNLYDRFKKGYVVDYLGLPGIPKLLFNLSDLFVFLGAVIVFIEELYE